MEITPNQTAALLVAVTLLGAILPLYRRWSERGLHLFVSVSAGIFLGTVFLHLLPHLAGVHEGGVEDAAGARASGAGGLAPWIAALSGLLFLFVLEKVWLPSVAGSGAPDPHRALWRVTWVGLGLHAVAEGVALAAALEQPAARAQLLFSILIHKATESFSLATVMRLAGLNSLRSIAYLLAFAALAPLGLLLGGALATSGGSIDSVLTGFACGTFLYVAVCDLLPEVFHGADRPGTKVAAVVAGILATAVTLPRISGAAGFGRSVALESGRILLDIAPYLLAGFAIAGVLKEFIKTEWLARHVAPETLKSTALATLVGAPLPLCSCSVVPVAVAMRRAGASKGATTAFLIATPETGVDSLTVSWAMLGPFLTVARCLGAVVSAIFTGGVVSWFVRSGLDARVAPGLQPASSPASAACCGSSTPADVSAVHEHAEGRSAGARAEPRTWLGRVLHYAFVEMMDDLAGSLVVGVLLSGVIAAVIPASVFETPLAHGFPGLLLMLAIGIPIYVCAAASTPIAAALIAKGMSPGAAFVFLLASPATNLGSLVLLSKALGRRVVLLQVAALSVVTLALGWAVDILVTRAGIAIAPGIGGAGHEAPTWITYPCAALLALLVVVALIRTRLAPGAPEAVPGDPQPSVP